VSRPGIKLGLGRSGHAVEAPGALGVAVIAAILVVVASPEAQPPSYGGIGATVAAFTAAHRNGPGEPPVGVTYYRVDAARGGRVLGYHVDVGWRSKRIDAVLLERLTGPQLPADAKLVQPYNGYCAIYQSRWLGRVLFGLPRSFGGGHVFRTAYIIVYVPTRAGAKRANVGYWWNEAGASVGPQCRG
jgi:hypothetical protein